MRHARPSLAALASPTLAIVVALLLALVAGAAGAAGAPAAASAVAASTPAVDLAALRNEARAGDAESQFALGWMYANARGVARDDATAAYFFTLAAAQGHVQAGNMLRFVGAPVAETPPCLRPPADDMADDGSNPAASATQQQVAGLVRQLAPEYGIHPRLVMAVIRAESNFEASAVSPRNAQGLMQLIPETSLRFNVRKPFDPEQNIRGGLAYLRWLLAYFEGDVGLVAAAYNAGEGAVNRYRGIPPYPETRDYVKRIVATFRKDEHPYDPAVTPPSPELPKIRLRLPKTL